MYLKISYYIIYKLLLYIYVRNYKNNDIFILTCTLYKILANKRLIYTDNTIHLLWYHLIILLLDYIIK